MALVKCKECSSQISTEAKSCPNCGAKPPKKTSLVTWIVLGFFVLVVYQGATRDNSVTPTPHRSTTATKVASVGSSKPTPAASSSTKSSTSTVQSAVPASKSSWEVHSSTDKMSGEVSHYITSTSSNSLKGWLKSGRILLGYNCSTSTLYARANDLGFTTDDVSCGSYSCDNVQYARVKFDSDAPKNLRFSVWDGNHDGMTLTESKAHNTTVSELVSNMQGGQTMSLEISLFNDKSSGQIAEFDLTGFSRAYSDCHQQVAAR